MIAPLDNVMDMQHYSLNGLRVFEAAARHLSFTAAADDLHITQAAVSQQIRRLEDQLDVQLFKRESGGLTLTLDGQELANATSIALSTINRAIERITQAETSGSLTISTLASFASKWLIPRLARFKEKHPEIELYVHTSGTKVDFARDGIDAAIRLGAAKDQGLNVDELMRDSLCLVASPQIAKVIGATPERLYEHDLILDGSRLLDDGSDDITGAATEKALVNLGLDKSRLNLSVHKQSDNVVLAALAGQGVALTRYSLCMGDLVSGRLDPVLGFQLPLHFGYSLVCPKGRETNPKLVAFKRWISGEIEYCLDQLSQ